MPESSRWRAIEDHFLRATELPGEARRRFLRDLQRQDPDLHHEVESLLVADTNVEEQLAKAIDTTLRQAPPSPLHGLRIERYEILHELGRGGMGTVFLARRDDHQYNMQVAIKVTRHGLLADGILHRMRQERHILAGLDHPNICKLLDGGTTADGLPYFVMEYIEGEPIDRFCDRHTLSVERRLGLFRQICGAVHYAHRKLVIHRDLKPSNILVTAEGIPKLLDFGIAKLLDPTAADGGVSVTTPMVTGSGMRLMTPAYASPEQVLGETLSTATDIYSLGVLLHRLLTGQELYQLANSSAREIERLICDQQPTLPSVAVAKATTDAEARQRAKRLQGDLDNIVSVALRKEPEQRYASADQLADDIDRHLDGRLVQARPHTPIYRASKFIRRHRLAVAAVTLVILSLSGGLGVALWQNQIAAAQRREAEVQRSRAEANQRQAEQQQRRSAGLVELMIGIFEVNDPGEARGNSVTVREILDTSVERIRSDLSEQSLDRADLLDSIGRVYQGLGLYDVANDLLEQSLATRGKVSESSLDLAASQNHLGELRLAQDRVDEAEELFHQSLAIRRQEAGEEDPRVIESLINLGTAAARQDQISEAEAAYAQALEIQERVLPEGHVDFIETLNNLAAVRWFQKDLESAEALYRRVLQLARRHRGEDHPHTVSALANLTTVMHSQGKFEAARPLAEETVALRRRLLEPEHPSLAKGLNTLSVLLYELGDFEGAEPLQTESIAIKRSKLGPAHRSTLSSLHNLAQLEMAQGRFPQAIETYRDIVAHRRREMGPNHPKWIRDLGHLGEALTFAGNLAEAESTFRLALSAPPNEPPDATRLATLNHGLATTLLLRRQPEDATASLDRALRSLADIEDAPLWLRVKIRGTAAAGRLALGDDAAARRLWTDLEPLIEQLSPHKPRDLLARRHLELVAPSLVSSSASLPSHR